MNKNLIIIGVIVLLIVGAGAYFLMQKSYTPNPETNPSEQTTLSGTPIQTYNIELKSFAFSPSELKIQPGDKVIWTNQDLAPHTITSDTGSEISSSSLSKGQTYYYTFTTTGTYNYHCSIHPSMKGTIVVE
jgi:plastocyanin